ncbi:serine hydrolase [Altererythrobacter salegens]|uniref:Serine hydrolase n=1 Tax=Croceibacterium salegens TaxID=1737568 RepID=A0A6I4SZR3_9SPHN|nr:serine hydrolase domain-containing protein [Croceibacterium salegens]MXO60356.1 serine hydrolase [Croceibacterium salegens]
MSLLRKLVVLLAVIGLIPLAAQDVAKAPVSGEQASEASVPQPKGSHELTAADLETWLDGYMPYALERGKIAGAVVIAVKDGKPLVEKGYGFADVAARRPVDPATTLFRPGSISKLLTWTAVMQQVEAGKLDLDADVNQYLDFTIPPFDGKPITLRNIMTHTAGFEESVRYLISSDPKAVLPLKDYSRRALPQRVFEPGTTPAYSNYATALAGYLVERVSGEDFDSYIEGHIFTPLGMAHSTFRQPLPKSLAPFMSNGYSNDEAPPMPFEIVIPGPAGSLSASGSDMGKFMLAHLANGEGLLDPATAKQMHEYHAPGIDPLNSMALGFFEQYINGHRGIGHGGDTEGFHSYLWIFPDDGFGLYIAMNSMGRDGAAYGIRNALMQKVADRYFPDPRTYTAIDEATAREHAQMIAGTYTSSRGSFTNFLSVFGLLGGTEVSVDADGKIHVPALDVLTPGTRDWVEIEPFVWRDANSGERLAARIENGKVTRISIDAIAPFTVLMPAPLGGNPTLLLPALLAALGLALLAALAWPVRALVRRHFKAEFGLTGRSLTAFRVTRVFAWAAVVSAAGWFALVQAFSADSGALGGSLDWLLNLLRVLTPLASLGLLASAGYHLFLCFRDKRRWTMKLGAALLVLAGLVLTYITFRYHLYGFGMVF